MAYQCNLFSGEFKQRKLKVLVSLEGDFCSKLSRNEISFGSKSFLEYGSTNLTECSAAAESDIIIATIYG